MDKIAKALKKLTPKEREKLKEILLKVESGNLQGLDVKKLKDRDDIFRIRKGALRIIFRRTGTIIRVLTLECRTSKTYRKR